MSYDIKLYVHGVPEGQKMWGIENVDADYNYIKAFYGRHQTEVPVLMFVEVRQFDSMSYCYYTYMCTDKVYDYNGRSGSYFALTLRINYFYADVQNIYNVLDAGYNKFIVGKVVQVNDKLTKYLVADFNENNDKVNSNSIFNSLESEFKKYLMQFSSDTDFIPLNDFKTNGPTGRTFNVHECVINTVTVYVKNSGSALLSPLYPSINEQQLISQVNEAKIQLQKEGEATRSKINSLSNDLIKAKEEVKRLNGALGKLTTESKNTEYYQKKYIMVSNELAKKNKVLERIKGELSSISDMTESLESSQISSAKKTRKIISIITKPQCLAIIQIALTLLLFLSVLFDSCEGEKEQNTQQTESDTRTSLDEQVLNADDSEAVKAMESNNYQSKDDVDDENENTYLINSKEEIKDDEACSQCLKKYKNVKIDIAEINSNKPMKFGDNSYYTLSLKNLRTGVSIENINGRWESKDFDIKGNTICPKHSGICKISFFIGDVVLTTRYIEVK